MKIVSVVLDFLRGRDGVIFHEDGVSWTAEALREDAEAKVFLLGIARERVERKERRVRAMVRWKVEQRERFLARRNGWYGVVPGRLNAGDVRD